MTDLWRGHRPARNEAGKDYTEFILNTDVMATLQAHTPEAPLFLFMSFPSIHAPLMPPSEWQQKYTHILDPQRRRVMVSVRTCGCSHEHVAALSLQFAYH